MAFNTIEYLSLGKVDFMYSLTPYDYNSLIENVRNSNKREIIIEKNSRYFMKRQKNFLLNIAYDIEKYKNLILKIITPEFLNDNQHLFNLINNTSWGTKYIIDNIEYIKKDNYINTIISILLSNFNNNITFIKQLSIHKNLHIRYLFQNHLIKFYPNKINILYDDITNYLTSYTYQEYEQLTFLPTLMDVNEVSKLASTALKESNIPLWNSLKQYILNNYPNNDLAEEISTTPNGKLELKKDINTLFNTSRRYQFYLFINYSELIAKKYLIELEKYLNIFKNDKDYDSALYKIFKEELFNKLKLYIDKYLDLSKTKETNFIGRGTTCSTYRIGDYALKLVKTKWSYEEIICPNLYLIAKNLEEDYIRDLNGIVLGGLEVQKLLTKKANDIPSHIFDEFDKELSRLGYFLNDKKINGQCGDNCMLLDSYLDADTHNHEQLPEWFKKYPLVLVDRDRIYKKDNPFIKQLKSGY